MNYLILISFYWEKDSNTSLRDQLDSQNTSTQSLKQEKPFIIRVNKNIG